MCIRNCGQTAADKVIVAIDSLRDSLPELVIALSNGTIADPPTTYRLTTIHALQTNNRLTETDDTSCPTQDSALQTFINAFQ